MGAMDEIRHIVVLMLENQSFDRLLGYLDIGDPAQKLEGLTGAETNPVAPPADMMAVPVQRVSSPSAYVTDPGPGHDFEDINEQLFAAREPQDTSAPRNAGFVLNYARQIGPNLRPLGDRGREIMQCLDPTLVPIITTLARSFTVCDHWFSSVPGPTWPNRLFLHAGTAKGFLETPAVPGQFASQFWNSPYDMPTIFENLTERGLAWTVYFDDYAQAFALRRLHAYGARFQRYEQFARDDEHGSFYDHVPPPRAVAPDSAQERHSGFRFDRLGVRVPAILISPWIPEGRVDHTIYDHTSVAATIKKMFGLPRFLTARDAAANTFERNFLPEPRAVSPANLKRLLPPARASASGAGALSKYQRSLLALAHALGSPPASAAGAGEATRHAQTFLQQSQSP